MLLGNLKKYSKLSFSLLFLFILFKSFIFFDHSINLKFADENLYSLSNTKFSPSLKNVFPIKVDPVKDATLHALDLLREYHKTYKFNKVYVDGSSRLTGKYGLDPHKMISLARFKNAPFRVGDVNVPKYNENSYKMIEEQGYDFIFLAEPWEDIYKKDKERYESFEDLKIINKYIKKIYSNYAQKFITLPKSSVQGRINFIIESIK